MGNRTPRRVASFPPISRDKKVQTHRALRIPLALQSTQRAREIYRLVGRSTDETCCIRVIFKASYPLLHEIPRDSNNVSRFSNYDHSFTGKNVVYGNIRKIRFLQPDSYFSIVCGLIDIIIKGRLVRFTPGVGAASSSRLKSHSQAAIFGEEYLAVGVYIISLYLVCQPERKRLDFRLGC